MIVVEAERQVVYTYCPVSASSGYHRGVITYYYDVWPIKIGPFLESGLVPLVLAPIWLSYGYLYPLLDKFFGGKAIDEANERSSSLSFVGLTWALCATQFIVSDVLYLQGFPHWQVDLALCVSLLASTWFDLRFTV